MNTWNPRASSLPATPGEIDARVSELAARLDSDHAAGRQTDFAAVDERYWVLALDCLIDDSRLETVDAAVRQLAALHPTQQYFASVRNAMERLPPLSGDEEFDAFRDDRGKDVQIARRPGSRRTILAFCAGVRLTLPLNLIHRWFGRADANMVYLRDKHAALYFNGVASLASDLDGTVAALRTLLGELATERLFCYGGSKGGYGCLLYGLLLEAEAVLALGAPTGLRRGKTDALPWNREIQPIDLRGAYLDAPRPPRTHLVYGEHMARDAEQARNLAGLATVSFEAVSGIADHNVAKDLVKAGRLQPLLEGLVDVEARARLWPAPDVGRAR